MDGTVRAPWTPDQVSSLNSFQPSGAMHPFTCGSDRHRRHWNLLATERGWKCPARGCEYTQDWAWTCMSDWTWRSWLLNHPYEPGGRMGTRGFMGFAVDGEMKISYNHYDSYPDYLGIHILEWLRRTDIQQAQKLAKYLRVVDADSTPCDEDIVRLAGSLNLRVGNLNNGVPSWYQLLRENQGDPERTLLSGVIEDASRFPYDSLFCEWGYMVDFDARRLDVYRGFQKVPHRSGAFQGGPPDHGHYPVKLVASWPFDDLPDDETFKKAGD